MIDVNKNYRDIIKILMSNNFAKEFFSDFLNNEPSEKLAVVYGISFSFEHHPNLDEPFVIRYTGEAVFPLSDGTKWRATVKNATWYGGNDELIFEKVS